MSAAHDNYMSSIGRGQYTHSSRRHPFIVQFPANCGITCHEAVKSRVGPERHSVLSASHAQVLVKTQEMGALQAQLGEAVVLDYTAMLPALKIERKTHALSQVDTTCADNDSGGIVFQAVLAPQEETGLASTVSMLRSVAAEMSSSSAAAGGRTSVSLHIDPSGLKAKKENIVTFEVGCMPGSEPTTPVTASTLSQLVSNIASLPMVLWVEHRQQVKTHNRWATGLCQSGTEGEHPMFESGLDGTGLVVGVSDTGIDMTHCQFYDSNVSTPFDVINHDHRKVVTYITYADDSEDTDGHGTHVASTAAGKSNIRYGDFVKYDGNAREAKIAFVDIGRSSSSTLTTPGNLNSGILQPLRAAGAKVSSHSWGSSNNAYSTDARNVDTFMYDFPDSLVLFAAGNDGVESGSNSVGSPSTNKNGISVAASINSYDVMRAVMGPDIKASLYSESSMAGFSSLGPVSDGRLKPDIAAPGWYTVAAEAIATAGNDHCDVQSLRGTSMASPTMAGNAVLIQQYFNEGFFPTGAKNLPDGFVPSGALLKAMLVHSGKAMDTVTYDDGSQGSTAGYPSHMQGYGRIRLSDVLNFGESTNNPLTLFVRGDTNESSPLYASLADTVTVDRYYVVASSSSSPIRVTMTYTDVPGTAGSGAPLVNDLELRVKLNSDVFVPHFNSYSDINNIEMVDIASPCVGCNYTIEVRAVSLSGVQAYALVATHVITEAVLNPNATSSSSVNTDESIGPDTMRIIIVLSIICFLLGSIVIYIHKFDAPPPRQKRQKTFAEEQHEQAEALRYYEEQRQRSLQPRHSAGDHGEARSRRGGRGGRDETDVSIAATENTARSRKSATSSTPRKKKKRRSSATGSEVEMAAQAQQASARI